MFRFKSLCLEDPPHTIASNVSLTSIIAIQKQERLDMNETVNDFTKQRRSLVPSFSGQKVCGVALCFRCRKPRCLYSAKPLTSHNSRLLHELLSTSEYACTSVFLPLGHPLEKTIYTKNLECSMAVETEYYHSSFAVPKTCSHCGGTGGELPRKSPRKTNSKIRPQLPICKKCQLLDAAI